MNWKIDIARFCTGALIPGQFYILINLGGALYWADLDEYTEDCINSTVQKASKHLLGRA